MGTTSDNFMFLHLLGTASCKVVGADWLIPRISRESLLFTKEDNVPVSLGSDELELQYLSWKRARLREGLLKVPWNYNQRLDYHERRHSPLKCKFLSTSVPSFSISVMYFKYSIRQR